MFLTGPKIKISKNDLEKLIGRLSFAQVPMMVLGVALRTQSSMPRMDRYSCSRGTVGVGNGRVD